MISIDIGGEGETASIGLTVSGCECRAEDFVMALIKFSNDWKKEADRKPILMDGGKKPCGCKGAKVAE